MTRTDLLEIAAIIVGGTFFLIYFAYFAAWICRIRARRRTPPIHYHASLTPPPVTKPDEEDKPPADCQWR